jgi:hypothetical protein
VVALSVVVRPHTRVARLAAWGALGLAAILALTSCFQVHPNFTVTVDNQCGVELMVSVTEDTPNFNTEDWARYSVVNFGSPLPAGETTSYDLQEWAEGYLIVVLADSGAIWFEWVA